MKCANRFLEHIKKPKNISYIIWVLPLFHLLLSAIAHQKIGYFFLNSRDPEYFHLISGVAISIFKFDPSYIDHPGIPIQIIIAIASRITFFFSDNKDIIQDVIQHPEVYIFASNLLFNIMLSLIIGVIGYKTIKYTGDFRAGLLLQLGFFANMNLIAASGRLTPEGFMLMPLGLLILLMIKYLYDEIPGERWRSYLIQFSILMGWGLATKLSFAPFFLIPLIIIPTLKRKALLMGLSIVAFLLIAFPVISHLNQFWEWTSQMFIHSGKWGQGEASFMSFAKLPERIVILYKMDPLTFILLGALLLESITLTLITPKIRFLKSYLRVSFSTIASVLLLLFFISKHFTPHYFIPAMLFKSFLLFLIIYPLPFWFKSQKIKPHFQWIGVAVAAILMIISLHDFTNSHLSNRADHQLQRLVDFRSKVSTDDILIISAHYSGAPFKEHALTGGALLCGPPHKSFKEPLRKEYPNTYMYYGWTKKFFKAFQYVDSKSLVSQDKPIFIYIGKKKNKDLDIILERFREKNPKLSFKAKQMVSNKHGGDKLYRLVMSKKKDKSGP